LTAPAIIKARAAASLQYRPELESCRVHGLGDYLRPGEFPPLPAGEMRTPRGLPGVRRRRGVPAAAANYSQTTVPPQPAPGPRVRGTGNMPIFRAKRTPRLYGRDTGSRPGQRGGLLPGRVPGASRSGEESEHPVTVHGDGVLCGQRVRGPPQRRYPALAHSSASCFQVHPHRAAGRRRQHSRGCRYLPGRIAEAALEARQGKRGTTLFPERSAGTIPSGSADRPEAHARADFGRRGGSEGYA
jgi:hypothetical protein